jgi:hypothetical protein
MERAGDVILNLLANEKYDDAELVMRRAMHKFFNAVDLGKMLHGIDSLSIGVTKDEFIPISQSCANWKELSAKLGAAVGWGV